MGSEGVDGRHRTSLETEFLVQEVSHWGQARSGAGTCRNDLVVSLQRVQLTPGTTVGMLPAGGRSEPA